MLSHNKINHKIQFFPKGQRIYIYILVLLLIFLGGDNHLKGYCSKRTKIWQGKNQLLYRNNWEYFSNSLMHNQQSTKEINYVAFENLQWVTLGSRTKETSIFENPISREQNFGCKEFTLGPS